MVDKLIKIIISLIRFRICNAELAENIKQEITTEIMPDLFYLSRKHNLEALIGDALYKSGLLEYDVETKDVFKEYQKLAFYKHVKQEYELKRIIKLLEGAQIPFIPLKGSVIRNFYPESYIRTSCDIDILIHEENLKTAIALIEEKLGYCFKGIKSHDAIFKTSSGVNIELHYRLIEKNMVNSSDVVLADIWRETTLKDGYKYYYKLNSEMFYFYHIAHMAKHFIRGGCGMRPFVDLWLINKHMTFDYEKRAALLQKGGLSAFSEAVEKLINVWFSGDDYTEEIKMLEDYIFAGGVYGNMENQVAMNQAKTDSKLKSAWEKIFLDYDIIKFYYPILKKHKWLLPYFEVKRWCRLIFKKEDRERSKKHLSINQNLSYEEKTQAKKLRDYLGI